MKNRIVALALTLVMVLSVAVASAATIPGNVKDIADLPAVPTVPTMKVKANDHTATVTLSQEVDYINVYWKWVPTAIEMNGTTGTYRVDSHKLQAGMGTWGKNSKIELNGIAVDKDGVDVAISHKDMYGIRKMKNGEVADATSDIFLAYSKVSGYDDDHDDYEAYKNYQISGSPAHSHYGNGPATGDTLGGVSALGDSFYGSHWQDWTGDNIDECVVDESGKWQAKPVPSQIQLPNGAWISGQDTQHKRSSYWWSTKNAEWAQAYDGYFGTYEMGFAYDLQYTDENGNQVYVRYDRFGNPVQIELTVYGGYDPFVGENPASACKITWVVVLRGSKNMTKRVWIVDNIKVNYDEGDVASITGIYVHRDRDNKISKQYTGKLVDYAVESR